MTAAPASPQQIRDRLLQAIDPQSNIHNMVAVLEVISSLEKYPITKEALEETRLGKLINDVRKKTKNEELAKRAKKLLRSWQKLIEPVTQNESVPRGLPNPPGSANGGAHNCRPDVSPATVPGSKPIHELKNRNDIQKLNSPKTEKLGNRKRKGEHRDGHQGPPSKVSKASHELLQNSSPLPTNGIGGSPENFPSPLDVNLHTGPESSRTEHSENDKHSKIPVNAVKPHTSSPGLVKPSSTSSQLKTTVLQHHEKPEEPTGQHQPKSPRCSFSSSNLRHEPFLRQHPTYAPKGSLPSPSQRPHFLDASQASSPSSRAPSLMQASTPPVPTKRPEASHQTGAEASQHWQEHTSSDSHQRHLGTLQHMTSGCKVSSPSGEPLMPRVGFSPEASKMDSDDNAASGSDSKKKKRYRSRDYTVNLDGQVLEGGVKPVRLKERKITFDPMTGQIKPLTQKDSLQVDIPALADQHRTEPDKPEQKTNLQSPFEQTNWKELSRNEIIQSYLNRQSSLLSSSGVQTPGAHYFMSEYLKQEESTRREARKTHVLVPNSISTDLPGVSREVTNDDLNRIRQLHWPGVNGCYDTQGNWYDWTQCISLDPHGDDGRLNILPYVCLD